SAKFGHLIVAEDLRSRLEEVLDETLTVKTTFLGKAIEHSEGKHPLYDRVSLCILGDHVTTESGTGIVHTAPGHGQEDFVVGQKYDLPILSPVDGQGLFTEEAGKFAGLNVLSKDKATSGNEAVIRALEGANALLKEEPYAHKYPYDWRTKEPTIFRATTQWFASVAGFRKAAMEAIESVQWIPAIGENRITAMVGDRSDWCISRQRAWGVPIPVFYDEDSGEALLTEETIHHVRDIFREQGSDAWWKLDVADLLPESYRNNGHTYVKGMDTMDVWFDSGSSWAAVADSRDELKYPVELYLEGSDQHRGWFQSSLLTSVAVNDCAPYQAVLTHGFVLDEKGQKMSKSIGNVVDPLVIINGGKNLKTDPAYGADVLRLWVSSVDYSGDVPIGKTILSQMADVYRKVRNTARFLLGNLSDFDPAQNAIAYEDLTELDRYILHRHREVCQEITAAFDSYQFFRFFQAVQNFCVVDLSNFYLDIGKDRLYISHANSPRRRQCQTVLALILENLAKAIAPVLSHMAEDIWTHLPYEVDQKSVFEAGWLHAPEQWHNPELRSLWNQLRDVRDEVNKAFDDARNQKIIGASTEAQVALQMDNTELFELLDARKDNLSYLFLASQVNLNQGGEGLNIQIEKADGKKCVRCWHYSTQVGESSEHPELCKRCIKAIAGEY
ncbi:MAG: isoleucine--tRNA ligase, partial [Cyanobacteria bacterium P01_D01_bin.123]